jgi:multidrug resistance efflux pump
MRIAVAALLLGLSVWAFMPYFAYRIAPSAFVNAELLRLTAPIAGRLTPNLPRKGEFIGQQAKVTLIESLVPDRRHLLDLERQYAASAENVELAHKQLGEIEAIDADLTKRTQAYQTGMIDRLTHEIDEANAERNGCEAEARQRSEVGQRMQILVQLGNASEIRSAEARATEEATETRCRVAQARSLRLGVELKSAQEGIYLSNGSNDVPYSQQQRDHLILRRQDLQTLLLQESRRLAQLTTEIAEERERLAQMDHYDATLPSSYVVWSLAASPGSAVVEGQTLADLADCQHRFVAVELPDRDFEQIKTGDYASVRLIGGNDWIEGRVRQVRGSAARADDRLLAARVPTPNAGNLAVEVELVNPEAPVDANGYCDIGRMAEVRFQRAGFGLSWALNWFSRGPSTAEGLRLRSFASN